MDLSINGHSYVPPGFRFHPTEEELLQYYLKKKVAYEKIDLDVIREVDLNKLEPWDIQEKCKIGSGPQSDWYFFSHKDKKYPTGTRTNRATAAGFWKATGRDKTIYSGVRRIGLRKTLVFYRGRAPHGQKSDWIMHEYRLDDQQATGSEVVRGDQSLMSSNNNNVSEDGWVICRVFKKKNTHRMLHNINPFEPVSPMIRSETDEKLLNQILDHIGRSSDSKKDVSAADTTTFSAERFMHLPALEYCSNFDQLAASNETRSSVTRDWTILDRLVASQLNGQAADINLSDRKGMLPPRLVDAYGPESMNVEEQEEEEEEEEEKDQEKKDVWSWQVYDDDRVWSSIQIQAPSSSPSSPSSSFDPLRHLSI